MISDTVAAPDIRAFEVYSDVPSGCRLEVVRDGGHAPHLRAGEMVVVDTNDREPALWELFAVLQSSGVNIWQIGPDRFKPMPADQGKETFWLHPLNRLAPHGTPEERQAEFLRRASNGTVYTSDGPIYGWALRERIIGRIVGVYQADLDERELVTISDGRAAQ